MERARRRRSGVRQMDASSDHPEYSIPRSRCREEWHMKIGVLGSGIVSQTLADGFLTHGHEAMRGTRDPAKLAGWKQGVGARAQVGAFADAARFGELVVIAGKGTAAGSVVEACKGE